MYNFSHYGAFESKIISSKDRFKLNRQQATEIKNKFFNSNILVVGAAGSIGSMFSIELSKFKFKKVYLVDKDENQLTELNKNSN